MLHVSTIALLLALGASKPLDGVPLRWKPTESTAKVLNQAARAFKEKKVQLLPFTDAREDRALIGRNTEDKTPKDVTTRDDVGAWCSGRLAELLEQAGVPVVTEGAEFVISGQVTRFMVDESDRYRGAVSLKLSVRDGAGQELWSGLVSGDSDHFGRSYKEENYMEGLSDSFLGAASGLFTDPDLVAEVQERRSAADQPPPGSSSADPGPGARSRSSTGGGVSR